MVTLIRQRATGDCGVAALATLVSATRSYDDVARAVATVDPERVGVCGLTQRQLLAVARRLGLQLQARRRFDLDSEEGLLRVYSEGHHHCGHWVAVRYRLVWDPNDTFQQPWREYLVRHGARVGTLLEGAV